MFSGPEQGLIDFFGGFTRRDSVATPVPKTLVSVGAESSPVVTAAVRARPCQ
jgi:hypothetical protein